MVQENEVSQDLPPRILYENSTSYLTLELDSQSGLYGIDLSPPNSKFGENVVAPEGNNYVALFDLENQQYEAKPLISADLKYDLVKGIEYKFLINYAKMN